jgi:hypothetical protein
MTGLPGWMRYGYSPGWMGRSPSGLGPAAHYLMHGAWPTRKMNDAWQKGQIPFEPMPGFPMPGFPTPYDPWGAAEMSPEQELDFLKAEAEQLKKELDGIEKKIKDLKEKK